MYGLKTSSTRKTRVAVRKTIGWFAVVARGKNLVDGDPCFAITGGSVETLRSLNVQATVRKEESLNAIQSIDCCKRCTRNETRRRMRGIEIVFKSVAESGIPGVNFFVADRTNGKVDRVEPLAREIYHEPSRPSRRALNQARNLAVVRLWSRLSVSRTPLNSQPRSTRERSA